MFDRDQGQLERDSDKQGPWVIQGKFAGHADFSASVP